MDAIRALQKQLQEAQKVSNVRKISERNCVDLVQKLVLTGQVRLVHTANGKEWLTPEQLDQEIQDALAVSGGRLNVTELPGEVGVAIEHVESRVDHLRKQDASLRKLQGELLTSQYVLGVAQEVGESLEEAGCLAVADLASRFSLPAEFIKEAVLPHVDAPGLVAKQNAIYTGTHAARVEARARGALRGCTEPTALSQLAGRQGLDVDMLSAAQRAVKSGVVLGKLQGSTFTPKAYSDAQASRLDSFFDSNQHLTLSLAKSAGVDVKDWVKSKKAEGVTLRTAFVSSHLVDSALASISEALSTESWIDAQPLLPPALAEGDACELLAHLESGRKLAPGAVVLGRVAMSSGFIRGIASQFEAEVKAAAERAMSAPAQAKAGKKAAAAAVDDDDDDGGSKKKGKRAAKGKKARSGEGDGVGDAKAGGGGSGESGVDDQAIWDLLAEKYPEIPVEAHAELTERLQPLLAAMVAEQQDALRSSLQSQQRALFEQAEKLVQERYEVLVLGSRALEAKDMQESPLQQHLLREAVTEPLHRMLAARLQESTGAAVEVTPANRKQSLDKLAAAEGSSKVASLSRLAAVLSKGKDAKDAKDAKEAKEPREDRRPAKGKKGDKEAKEEREEAEAAPADVSELYRAAAEDCHIFCRRVDKKREKAALQEKRAEHREKLKELAVSDSAQVFRLGLQLALIQDGVVGLLFPEEPWAFRIVAKALADEAVREKADALCGLLEAGEDAVALEAAVAEWREQALGGK